MRPQFAHLGCGLVLMAGLVAGCQSMSGGGKPYPKDPLLLSKKPVEGGSSPTMEPSPPQLAAAEPVQPQVPATALVSATAPAGISRVPAYRFATDRTSVSAKPVVTLKAPLVAIPAVRSNSAPEALGGTYGHAPDHRWLQGVLDKHYQGHFGLRYCDAAVEDSWGGKVRLEADPRLAQFQDGDVIRVEGDLVPRETGAAQETWDHYPHYRIRNVELIQRKN
jgi:hypothetical protein